MSPELERTGRARRAAELALVRVCNHYGAFVLLHHNEVFDDSGPLDPGDVVLQRLGAPFEIWAAVEDLAANFSDDRAQGVQAYVDQLLINNPGLDPTTAATDAQLAVAAFTTTLLNAITC